MKKYTMKIGDKYMFAARLVSRFEDDSMTTLLEKLLHEMADTLKISRHWLDLWDEEPSIAMLNIFSLPEYQAPKTVQKSGFTNESVVYKFVRAHLEYFYADKARKIPHRPNAVVLWPHVEELANEWKNNRHEGYGAAAEKMNALLKKAKLPLPG